MLLVASGLMVRSFIMLQAVDGGFDADRVLTALVDLDWVKYRTPETRRTFFRTFLAKLEAEPKVRHAAFSLTFPLNDSSRFNADFIVEGRAPGMHPPALADFRLASPSYFQAIGMTLLGGRAFGDSDDATAPPVAIVNVSMARHQFDATDPTRAIGRRISLDNGRTWRTIVGLVNDVKQYGLDTNASDELYLPFDQRAPLSATLLVRAI